MPGTADPFIRLGIPLALLAIPTLLFLRARLNFQRIPKLRRARAGPQADCMVVIPARNEGGHIARAVKSFPHDTVIVVNDGSTDATAEKAREAGAGVINASPAPRGVFGKPHACQAGAEVLLSRWVLFADADTWYEDGFLEAVVDCAESSAVDFLSVHLRPGPGLLGPYAQALYYSGVDPKWSPLASFRGQCVLVRREAYGFTGGHGSVKRHMADDIQLARLAQRHRTRIGVVRAGALGHADFHSGGLREGVIRSAFRAFEASHWIAAVWMATATFAVLWLPSSAWLWFIGERTMAGAAMLLPFVWMAGWYRDWRFLLAPVAIYAMAPLVWRGAAAAITGRKVPWKGRTI